MHASQPEWRDQRDVRVDRDVHLVRGQHRLQRAAGVRDVGNVVVLVAYADHDLMGLVDDDVGEDPGDARHHAVSAPSARGFVGEQQHARGAAGNGSRVRHGGSVGSSDRRRPPGTVGRRSLPRRRRGGSHGASALAQLAEVRGGALVEEVAGVFLGGHDPRRAIGVGITEHGVARHSHPGHHEARRRQTHQQTDWCWCGGV